MVADGAGSTTVEKNTHRFRRVDVLAFHEPTRFICPDRNGSEANGPEIPRHFARKTAIAIARVGNVIECTRRCGNDKGAPKLLLAVA